MFLVGEADLISLVSNRVIHKYRFNERVLHLRFSPDGKHIAACKLNKSKLSIWYRWLYSICIIHLLVYGFKLILSLFSVFILQTPGHFIGQFNQFALERVFSDILGDTTYVAWTDDSRYMNFYLWVLEYKYIIAIIVI